MEGKILAASSVEHGNKRYLGKSGGEKIMLSRRREKSLNEKYTELKVWERVVLTARRRHRS